MARPTDERTPEERAAAAAERAARRAARGGDGPSAAPPPETFAGHASPPRAASQRRVPATVPAEPEPAPLDDEPFAAEAYAAPPPSLVGCPR